MSLRITILGCGSSAGVPRVGVGWGACDPENPRNRRRRCSILVERLGPGGATRVLVDTGPDLRDQLLGSDIRHLDAVLITHDHADHTHGIDDLRPLVIAMRRRMPVYMDAVTSDVMLDRFGYCFRQPPGSDYPAILDEYRMEVGTDVTVEGAGGAVRGRPFRMIHGGTEALGFRFGDVAYAPDVSRMPEESLAELQNLEVLIIDALRYTPHPSHFSVSEALALIEALRPKRAILTNLHTDLDYETLRRELPERVEPAFDGLAITSP
jgi:phosphoribosyl 1,2-cyclic phosphate phosphodiesterase